VRAAFIGTLASSAEKESIRGKQKSASLEELAQEI